jgi:LytR cell envelope-related transcriptional attenuator
MQTERPPTERPRTAASNPARGVVLVAVAVILGLFLLRALDDTSSPDGTATASSATVGDGDAPAGEDGGGNPTTETPVHPPPEVTVRVANASGVQGAASARTDQLAGAGYKTIEATNGPQGQRLAATEILFVDGFQREAQALAEQLGAPAEGVAPLPNPPPVDPGGAQVVVLLGTDLAGT